jgi:uncharacterized membrane protein
MDYLWVKWVHIMSATLLFGVGVGSAFFLLLASLGANVQGLALVSRLVVWADGLFTATTAVVQPVTGFYLVHQLGLPWSTPWIAASTALYVLAIACWLPVVGLQVRMRDMAAQAAASNRALPAAYGRLLRWWVGLGWVALFAFLAIFYLMVAKPV